MQINTQIEIERNTEDGECNMVTVDVSGTFESFGSANPHERGLHLGSWDAVDAATGDAIILTSSEKEYAVDRLYAEI